MQIREVLDCVRCPSYPAIVGLFPCVNHSLPALTESEGHLVRDNIYVLYVQL